MAFDQNTAEPHSKTPLLFTLDLLRSYEKAAFSRIFPSWSPMQAFGRNKDSVQVSGVRCQHRRWREERPVLLRRALRDQELNKDV